MGARWSPSFPRQSLARRRARNVVQVHVHALNRSWECYHVVRIGLGAIWGHRGRRRSLYFTTPHFCLKKGWVYPLCPFPPQKNGGKSPRGDLPKSTTHNPHTHLTHTAAPTMSGLNIIYEKQLKTRDGLPLHFTRLIALTREPLRGSPSSTRKRSEFSDIYSTSVQQHQEQQPTIDNNYCRKEYGQFFCVPPGGECFFFRKNIPPGLTQR